MESFVGDVLVAAFTRARMMTPGLAERWVHASFRVGGLLPTSLISKNVQRLGEIDAVCRCLERELVEAPLSSEGLDMRLHYYAMMAELWMGTAYSICFIINNRKLAVDAPFQALNEDLRLVRVQLEKYEIPSDRDLESPIEMTTGPSGRGQPEPRNSIYDYKDKRRAHIGRSGLSDRHSLMWEVIEVDPVGHRWLERTNLSDRFLVAFT
jgi:hypothetical protein